MLDEAGDLEEIAEQGGKGLAGDSPHGVGEEEEEKPDLDMFLDQTSSNGSTGDSAFGGARRSHAIALRALTKASTRTSSEDFSHTPAALGLAFANFQNHVRWSWQVGGILDNLVAGDPEAHGCSQTGQRRHKDRIVLTVALLQLSLPSPINSQE